MTQSADIGALPNISGFDFRTRLNIVCKALASLSSGSTAPLVTEPFMLWVDQSTTPATLRQRTAANDAWVAIGQLRGDGTIAWAGSVPSPSSPVVGDLLAWDGSAWSRVAAGASGHALRSNGAGVVPSWQSSSVALGALDLIGEYVDTAAIPATAHTITIGFVNARWSAGSLAVKAISAAGVEESGYAGCVSRVTDVATTALDTAWRVSRGESGIDHSGSMVIDRLTSGSGAVYYAARSVIGGVRTSQMGGHLLIPTGGIVGLRILSTVGNLSGGSAYVRYSV